MQQYPFNCHATLEFNNRSLHYVSLPQAEANGLEGIGRLPFCLKVLLENVLRHQDEEQNEDHAKAFVDWLNQSGKSSQSIGFYPARILMQDFTGVPAMVDLATMREQCVRMGGNAEAVTPRIPVDLVIDHSVQVDTFGNAKAFETNVAKEVERNHERYAFLKWAQSAFDGLRVVPPGMGICHQVNIEYLAQCVWSKKQGDDTWIFPDTLVGTDSHTTMANGLGVLGWGVGGIEAEACMMGQSVSMLLPEVIGVHLTGKLSEGVFATDLVLRITEMLREYGVVGKIVEFFGEGARALSLADRATISNMAPEYGATAGIFAMDGKTLMYLRDTNREPEQVALVKAYLKAQQMWPEDNQEQPVYTDVLSLDLASVQLSVAGPSRPQDRVLLGDLPKVLYEHVPEVADKVQIKNPQAEDVQHGDVVIAAITSCTNTSNPFVMLAAGLLAKKAVEKGIAPKPWVKTSLAPGSKVVTDYLQRAGLLDYLEQIGFNLVGYGCTTCIGNSGPLPEAVAKAVDKKQLKVAAVLSGNRNFEGRIHPQVKLSWLASPPLVVAYALAGRMDWDKDNEPVAMSAQGEAVYWCDIWPSHEEITACLGYVQKNAFAKEYATIFDGEKDWQDLIIQKSLETYDWAPESTYVKHPPFLVSMQTQPGIVAPVENAQILAVLGDSVTTDHISPAGAIAPNSPAGQYLQGLGVDPKEFNSYGARRGNHEVMMRGTFANIRIRNAMTPDHEGGWTRYVGSDDVSSIYDVAMQYQQEGIPLVVVAGKEYGTGSSRDWAAKGTLLLGVKVVIAESYERIHRSNLIGMGVLPLQFPESENAQTLGLTGQESLSFTQVQGPKSELALQITYANGEEKSISMVVRIDTQREFEYYCHGGILAYALRQML